MMDPNIPINTSLQNQSTGRVLSQESISAVVKQLPSEVQARLANGETIEARILNVSPNRIEVEIEGRTYILSQMNKPLPRNTVSLFLSHYLPKQASGHSGQGGGSVASQPPSSPQPIAQETPVQIRLHHVSAQNPQSTGSGNTVSLNSLSGLMVKAELVSTQTHGFTARQVVIPQTTASSSANSSANSANSSANPGVSSSIENLARGTSAGSTPSAGKSSVVISTPTNSGSTPSIQTVSAAVPSASSRVVNTNGSARVSTTTVNAPSNIHSTQATGSVPSGSTNVSSSAPILGGASVSQPMSTQAPAKTSTSIVSSTASPNTSISNVVSNNTNTGSVNTGSVNTGPVNTGPVNTGSVNIRSVSTGSTNVGAVTSHSVAFAPTSPAPNIKNPLNTQSEQRSTQFTAFSSVATTTSSAQKTPNMMGNLGTSARSTIAQSSPSPSLSPSPSPSPSSGNTLFSNTNITQNGPFQNTSNPTNTLKSSSQNTNIIGKTPPLSSSLLTNATALRNAPANILGQALQPNQMQFLRNILGAITGNTLQNNQTTTTNLSTQTNTTPNATLTNVAKGSPQAITPQTTTGQTTSNAQTSQANQPSILGSVSNSSTDSTAQGMNAQRIQQYQQAQQSIPIHSSETVSFAQLRQTGQSTQLQIFDPKLLPQSVVKYAILGETRGIDQQGRTLIQTEKGMIAVHTPRPLPPNIPIAFIDPQQLQPILNNQRFTAMENLLQNLDTNSANTVRNSLPQPNAGMVSSILFYMLAQRHSLGLSSWLGDQQAQQLQQKNASIFQSAEDEFRTAQPAPLQGEGATGWQNLSIPLNVSGDVMKLVLYWRNRKGQDQQEKDQKVFALEGFHQNIGRFRLDGQFARPNLNVQIASDRSLEDDQEKTVTDLFYQHSERWQISGQIQFSKLGNRVLWTERFEKWQGMAL